MSEQRSPDPSLEQAGLSATGRTADQMEPGEATPGTTYGDPGGPGTAYEEIEGAGPENAGQPDDGDVENA